VITNPKGLDDLFISFLLYLSYQFYPVFRIFVGCSHEAKRGEYKKYKNRREVTNSRRYGVA